MEYTPSFRDELCADIQPSYSDSLMHHGIKGQKWGVRRFQNADGSYTAAGKARRGSSNSISKKLTSSKAAKIAAGAAITAAGVAALAYMNNSDMPTISDKMAEKAVGKYCNATRKAAGDLYDETRDTFAACRKAFEGDWPSIDAQTCRTNAQLVRKDANDMFQAHSKSRVPFVDKAWRNSAGTSRRSKARADMNRTDEAISNYRDSMLEYADMYDHMADELDARRKPKSYTDARRKPKSYTEKADEFRESQVAKWKQERKERKKQEVEKLAEQRRKTREAEYKRRRDKEAYDKWKEDQDYWSSH